MRTLERTVRSALVCGVFGTAVAGAMASGCGGDDSGTPGPDGSGADQTVDTSSEGSTAEASQQDNARPDSSLSDGSPQGDGSPNDVQQDIVQDSQGSDRADTGDAAEAAAMMGDASDGGACVTSAAQLAAAGDGGVEGGLADSGSLAPTLLFSFDSPGGLDINWGAYTPPGQSSALLGQTFTDGYPCAGALDFALTYSGFAGNSGVFYNYANQNGPGPQDWSARTNLHIWVKLVTSNYALLGGIEVILHSGPAFKYTKYSAYLAASAFASQGANQGWRETVLSLAAQIPPDGGGTTGFDPASVDEIEFQVQAPGPQVDGGPAAPSPTTLLVDSIWLE
jgi:hypothetical protein